MIYLSRLQLSRDPQVAALNALLDLSRAGCARTRITG